ncbi:hypothetical protein GH714_014549 [Hevea brasiliensis]|uniref:hydroxyacylglutathione hydrolase n=1 Tax=Hevea brasiliensis TaxID=3981 RepID=A0A6A6MZG0_HEVBR|nr:hypothetical protein GH714_014549 [Hevea brasiliensis]
MFTVAHAPCGFPYAPVIAVWSLSAPARIIDESNKEAAVVDPVKPNKILQVANQHHANIKDHAGGNEKMKPLVPRLPVHGGSSDNIKGCTHHWTTVISYNLGLGSHVNILALHTPCHTKGHISYFVTGKEGEDPAVFTGDTLFIAGCGKFVEGTGEQMYRSLCQTLGSLPKPTQVYCGHEYTVKNLQFALTVELDNVKKQQKLSWAQQKRLAGLPTIPSSFEEEWETNPFLRVDLPDLQEDQRSMDSWDIFHFPLGEDLEIIKVEVQKLTSGSHIGASICSSEATSSDSAAKSSIINSKIQFPSLGMFQSPLSLLLEYAGMNPSQPSSQQEQANNNLILNGTYTQTQFPNSIGNHSTTNSSSAGEVSIQIIESGEGDHLRQRTNEQNDAILDNEADVDTADVADERLASPPA